VTAPELLTEPPELDPVEQRVLGSLMEKQRTVPASYPLSQNALRTACNQASSRDPVVDYDDRTVLDALARLKERGLIRTVWAGAGSRVLKYHQRLEERLGLAPDHKALLTLLLLRGPQSPGELRARADRLHPFAHRHEVEASLRAMAELPLPLVRELERQAGQHDRRWVHLLGPPPEEAAAAMAVPQVDRDVVLQDGAAARDARVRDGYDRVAEAYADQYADELAGKPFDRWLLDRVAEVAGPGPIADVGCGPGHTTFHLADMGTAVTGFDVAPAMVEAARRRFPDVDFQVGDLRNLLRPPAAAAWQGIVAWYALVHLAGSELPAALASLTRVLAPGGWLALAVHIGEAVWPVTELCGTPVELEFVMHDRDEVLAAVTAAGLVDVEWYLRAPYPGVEAATERLYVLARRAV
jgi:uncharacterized protein YceH (UPF0502 family)